MSDWNKVEEHIFLENVPGEALRFMNFRGMEQPPYNPKGKRNFSIDILDEGLAEQLAEDGWNIKFSEPNEDGYIYPPRLTVQLNYKFENLAPKIMMEQAGAKVYLNEDTVGDLDSMDILNIKAIDIRPYNWEIKKKDGTFDRGVTAYLDKMRVVVARDIFCD